MLERRTFIVRIHAREAPILEDVLTGQRVRLPDLPSLAAEIKRRLNDAADDGPAVAAAKRLERP